MALDTFNKRATFLSLLPAPDGTIATGDRYLLLRLYPFGAAVAPVIQVVQTFYMSIARTVRFMVGA